MASIRDRVIVTLTADTSAMDSALAELDRLPKRAKRRLLRSVDRGESLFRLKSNDGFTPGTHELVVRLEPSKFLSRFLAAATAGN